jgi:hypothetical protein
MSCSKGTPRRRVRPSTTRDKIFVFAIVGLILLLFVALILAGMYVIVLLGRALFAHR